MFCYSKAILRKKSSPIGVDALHPQRVLPLLSMNKSISKDQPNQFKDDVWLRLPETSEN